MARKVLSQSVAAVGKRTGFIPQLHVFVSQKCSQGIER